ncbi:MAG: circadian clock protein KaiC [Candidatus Competibacteraceae bacterium]
MPEGVAKAPTGIKGLDEITGGGLPRGRPTLVAGGAGCGKTLLAMEFLVRGIQQYGEPGVFMAFEETAPELTQNVRSLGFDLDEWVARKQLMLDHVHIDRNEIEETGEYDLDGLFVRLAYAIDTVGAKRVVLDTLESLFSNLPNEAILRAELRRLFRWLKDKGVTAVITAERGGAGAFTRHGLEEYVSDCVILLEHRVAEQIATRRLRVVKYRGSSHGADEYPFLIDNQGLSVLPISSLGLNYPVSAERVSSGIPALDTMLGGQGFYRGSSILLSGMAGTGKTSIAAGFVDAACKHGERCLYLAFEESEQQILRNMGSIGLYLGRWIEQGLLQFRPARPTQYGLEMHLALIHRLVSDYRPEILVMDPITNLIAVATRNDVRAMLMRLVDFLKMSQITTLFTSLTHGGYEFEQSELGVSSLMDTWIQLQNLEVNGERNRGIQILKSRGMNHSNQIREFVLSDQGAQIVDVYLGSEGVLTGSARLAREAEERAEKLTRRQQLERARRDLQRKRQALEARIAVLQAEFVAEEEDLMAAIAQDERRENVLEEDRAHLSRLRQRGASEPDKEHA